MNQTSNATACEGSSRVRGTITAQLVGEGSRMRFLPSVFGERPMLFLTLEQHVYNWMSRLTQDYGGGHWHFHRLSNGGGFMSPAKPDHMTVCVGGNGFAGQLSAEACGIVATLFTLSHLAGSLRLTSSEAELIADRFEQLRDFAADHAEASLIYRAID